MRTLVFLLFCLATLARTQDSSAIQGDIEPVIDVLEFKNTPVKDIVRAVADRYRINVVVDDRADNRLTLHLYHVPVREAIQTIARQAGLEIVRHGSVIELKIPPNPEPPPPPPLDIRIHNDLLSMDLNNADLTTVTRILSEKCPFNIVPDRGVQGKLSAFLIDVPLEQGLETLFQTNGFRLYKRNGVLIVSRGLLNTEKSDNPSGFWVQVTDSLVSLEAMGANIRDILHEIATQLDLDLVIYGEVEGAINARCRDLNLEQALHFLFKGTSFTFRKEKNVYVIGDRSVEGLASFKLLRLQHMKADGLVELLPPTIKEQARVQLVKEHNGLMVIGTDEVIREAEAFVEKIDHPIPQILIEALVVDYNRSEMSEFSIEAGIGKPDTTSPMSWILPRIETRADGDYLNSQISLYGPQWNLPQVGKLPSDFFVRIKALERNGIANIRSRPQIATLNGHTASISIGTTQYFILKTNTPYQSPNQIYVQESQRFETIKAEMLLEITPWVSASGEITTEIHPEFSTPRGNLDAERPPTIDHRILDSTVKLRDGETIVLGGLIQESDTQDHDRWPILHRIPIIGKLFQSRSSNKSTTELMIYVTPHLSYTGQ